MLPRTLYAVVLVMLMPLLVGGGAVPLQEQMNSVTKALQAKRAYVDLNWPVLEADLLGMTEPRTVVFIHATIGVFPRKRGREGTWGHGLEILIEMLRALDVSGLMSRVHRVYVGALGAPEALAGAQRDVLAAFAGRPLWRDKLVMAVSAEDLGYSEFPTLLALQVYARATPESLAGRTLLLYMHTKGVRQNGEFAAQWRDYMLYMLVARAEEGCLPALLERGFASCGALKTPTGQGAIYAGNFWWATAKFLQGRPDVQALPWTHAARYAAENFLLRGVPQAEDRASHYCVHHTHHDMQNCPTLRDMYRALPLTPLRTHGNCYSAALRPRNQSRLDRKSWCHSVALPPVP